FPIEIFPYTLCYNTFKGVLSTNNTALSGNSLHMIYSVNCLELRVEILMDCYWIYRNLRIIVIVVVYLDMPVKGCNFFSNFILETYTGGNGNKHHHQAKCNCSNCNFYNWC